MGIGDAVNRTKQAATEIPMISSMEAISNVTRKNVPVLRG